jgi:hypothetical protein
MLSWLVHRQKIILTQDTRMSIRCLNNFGVHLKFNVEILGMKELTILFTGLQKAPTPLRTNRDASI